MAAWSWGAQGAGYCGLQMWCRFLEAEQALITQ